MTLAECTDSQISVFAGRRYVKLPFAWCSFFVFFFFFFFAVVYFFYIVNGYKSDPWAFVPAVNPAGYTVLISHFNTSNPGAQPGTSNPVELCMVISSDALPN